MVVHLSRDKGGAGNTRVKGVALIAGGKGAAGTTRGKATASVAGECCKGRI